MINSPAKTFLSDFQLTNNVKRSFEENYLRMLFEKHHQLPKTDIIEFIHKAQLTGANPSLQQIFLIERSTKMPDGSWKKIGVTVFSYNFILAIANQSGDYNGYRIETGPKPKFDPFTSKEKLTLQSTAYVKRGDIEFAYTAWFDEYFQENKQWKEKPVMMIEKCALAGSLRRGWPEALSGMYSNEEISQIEDEIDRKARDEAIEVHALQTADHKDKVIESALTEDYEDKEKVLEALKILLGEMTKGATPIEKTTVLRETCGVNKFDDLKSFDSTFLQSLLVKLNTLRNNSLEKLISKKEVINNSTELKKDVAESNAEHLSSPSAAGPKAKPKTVADATFTIQ